mmetsp:Transcript_42017/g.40306  ORF Transcript_42017/g.40306 Transcript_42017/m.40306 type:complete len:86 (+) Transcript_42017:41-298(+)
MTFDHNGNPLRITKKDPNKLTALEGTKEITKYKVRNGASSRRSEPYKKQTKLEDYSEDQGKSQEAINMSIIRRELNKYAKVEVKK